MYSTEAYGCLIQIEPLEKTNILKHKIKQACFQPAYGGINDSGDVIPPNNNNEVSSYISARVLSVGRGRAYYGITSVPYVSSGDLVAVRENNIIVIKQQDGFLYFTHDNEIVAILEKKEKI